MGEVPDGVMVHLDASLSRGVAVYTELGRRSVTLPVVSDVKALIVGPATIQYIEISKDGVACTIAEAKVVLR